MDLKELKEILQILEEKEITEFELEEQGMKLRIRKAASASPNHAPAAAPAPRVASAFGPTLLPASGATFPAGVESGGAAGPSVAASAAAVATESGLAVVKSPIVGTFYRSPDPNSPSFVSVGDHVKVGQVLCIIEAMKLMNEIEAEVAGEVMRIHRENGQPVQYGEPLFTIRPE